MWISSLINQFSSLACSRKWYVSILLYRNSFTWHSCIKVPRRSVEKVACRRVICKLTLNLYKHGCKFVIFKFMNICSAQINWKIRKNIWFIIFTGYYVTEIYALRNWLKYHLPNISFLFPCTISFPAIFTKENFSSFPIFKTWLQFSTFLNGNFIGGRFAIFQLTEPGAILSITSSRTHLQLKYEV